MIFATYRYLLIIFVTLVLMPPNLVHSFPPFPVPTNDITEGKIVATNEYTDFLILWDFLMESRETQHLRRQPRILLQTVKL
jgi:hypothetical protein